MNPFDLSAALLLAFAVLGAVDGLYLHLWRFRLHARPETRAEHRLHTWRAVLMVPMLPLVFAGDTSGLWLWLGVAVVLADLGLTLADVLAEQDSREFQGGLPRGEFRLHVVLTVLHLGAIGLALWARPAEAWFGAVEIAGAQTAHFVAWVVLLPGTVAVAALHVALAVCPDWNPLQRYSGCCASSSASASS